MHSQPLINQYFEKLYESDAGMAMSPRYPYSGLAIAEKIKDGEQVIDIGCGRNWLKDHIMNLTGIDPVDAGADVITTLLDYKTDQTFDVALIIGSMNFGDEAVITAHVDKVNQLLNPSARVYWRVNPADILTIDEGDTLGSINHLPFGDIKFFPWTNKILAEYAKKYGFTQINERYEFPKGVERQPGAMRLYVEWVREDLHADE